MYCGKGSINVMLAQTYDPELHDPSGWLLSEKLDGVRCYWNGSVLYTRNGAYIRAPKEWLEKLPKIALDGELWTGRDEFHKAVSITIHREHDYEHWKEVKYMVFDAPLVPGTFKERLSVAKKIIEKAPNDTVQMIKQIVCKDVKHL